MRDDADPERTSPMEDGTTQLFAQARQMPAGEHHGIDVEVYVVGDCAFPHKRFLFQIPLGPAARASSLQSLPQLHERVADNVSRPLGTQAS